MLDITQSNFEAGVIEASRRHPVLLDIWAPWCGPCKTLGPLLEKLEGDYEGRFSLAKLNSDEEAEIAGQLSRMFGVRSIPFCVLFRDGQPADGFVGALTESELRSFLDRHVAPGGELPRGDDAGLARELLSAGRLQDALDPLRQSVRTDPGDARARFDLLRTLLRTGALEEAQEIFAPVDAGVVPRDEDLSACGVWIEACLAAGRSAENPDTDAVQATGPANLGDRFHRAQTHLAAGRFTQALDELLEILMRDKQWRAGVARTTFLAVLRVMRSFEADADTGHSLAGAEGRLASAGARRTAPQSASDAYHRRLSMVLF